MPESYKQSLKYQEAMHELPKELHGIFERLVSDYRAFALMRHGGSYVSYGVLADMVSHGWVHRSDLR
jgi:hypothetical protein